MYLDYAEEQAELRQPLYMRDRRDRLDGFLQFHQRDILRDAGRVSAEVPRRLALEQYDRFERRRLREEALEADAFDQTAKQLAPARPEFDSCCSHGWRIVEADQPLELDLIRSAM